ncbi:MAG: hypothetical protein IIA64_10645, partial [Planctomycetes bacterium]|nr:hypothetical protein [Planctomycetota bacterium]
MSSIPSNLARVPNTLVSQIVRSSLTRTQQDILRLQIQLTTGKAVNRASDNPVAASSISVLDDLIERRDQRLRNLSHGDSVLGNVDAALGDASEMLLEAKGIGSSQIGVGSDAETRKNQAQVIDAMINQLIGIANRQFQDLYLFGGDATANPPIVELLGGLQYQGVGDGMTTDVGSAGPLAITMSGEDAFGTLSARVQGAVDLNPTMTGNTRLLDLNGGRGFGISLGTINADVNGVDVVIDLSDAHTVSDVIATLEAAIQTEDPGA